LERILRISKEQKDYAETNLSDQEEICQFVQDHEFIMNTQKKVELLMEHRLSELVNINRNSHNYPQHNIIPNAKRLKLESTNLEHMKFYPSIQQRGWNQLLEELMKDIRDEIETIQSQEVIVKFQTTSPASRIFAIHLYLATVINFLQSTKIINNEMVRKLFEDDKNLFWINQLNLFQLNDEFPSLLSEGYTDVANQWFWRLKWDFLRGMSIYKMLFIDHYKIE
jgi:hypothetical protein